MRFRHRANIIIAFFVLVILLFVVWKNDTLLNCATLIAEFAIAAVIYYEIEENRATAFLSEVEKSYANRAKIYSQFVAVGGNTLDERAELFQKKLYSNVKLRQICEHQLVQFSRFQYMLRWSLFHRDLMVKWYPQVIVKLWVMLHKYVESREAVPIGHRSMMTAVLQSLKYMECKNIHLTAFYSEMEKRTLQSLKMICAS